MTSRPPLTLRSLARILLLYLGAIACFVVLSISGVVLYVTYDGPTARIGGLAIALFGTLIFFAATVKMARDFGADSFDRTDEFMRTAPRDHGSDDPEPPEAA